MFSELQSRLAASLIIAVVVLGSVGYALWPEKGMVSQSLQCDSIDDVRARTICERLEQEMRWTWFGHAIISPGWRVNFHSVKRTYCLEKTDRLDIPALDVLRRTAKDRRVETGADFLVRLIRNKDGTGDEDAASIFNPANPSFILKEGCLP